MDEQQIQLLLNRLERENKIMKLGIIGTVLLAGLVFLMGSSTNSLKKDVVAKEIVAEKITLKDQEGRIRAQLFTTPPGSDNRSGVHLDLRTRKGSPNFMAYLWDWHTSDGTERSMSVMYLQGGRDIAIASGRDFNDQGTNRRAYVQVGSQLYEQPQSCIRLVARKSHYSVERMKNGQKIWSAP